MARSFQRNESKIMDLNYIEKFVGNKIKQYSLKEAETEDDYPVLCYSGWAPCHHPPAHIVNDDYYVSKDIRLLIYNICFMAGASVNVCVDMWWGVAIKGTIEDYSLDEDPNAYDINFYIQGDTLELALNEAYKICSQHYKNSCGREWTLGE